MTIDSRRGKKDGTERFLRCDFDSWQALLDARIEIEPAGLFLAGRYDIGVGDDVIVHCTFPGDRDGARLHARVAWRRLRGGADPGTRPGVGLALAPVSVTPFRRLVDAAEGRAAVAGRRQERFPVRFPVRAAFGRHAQTVGDGEVIDLSDRGVSIRIPHRPGKDEPVVLLFDDPIAGSCKYEGYVAWVRGNARAPKSMHTVGVRLDFCKPQACTVWEQLVARARTETRLRTEYRSD